MKPEHFGGGKCDPIPEPSLTLPRGSLPLLPDPSSLAAQLSRETTTINLHFSVGLDSI